VRINRAINQPPRLLDLRLLAVSDVVDEERAEVMTRLVFEAEEVLQCGLWFRRLGKEQHKLTVLRQLAHDERDWPYGENLFERDVRLLSMWITGASFEAIADEAPRFDRGIFSDDDPASMASDASEFISDIAQKAGWGWSGVVAILGERDFSLPTWLRRAIEFGLPSQTAVELVLRTGLSRPGALRLASFLPAGWEQAETLARELNTADLNQFGLTSADGHRLVEWHETRVR
jgi:hypothetical protein